MFADDGPMLDFLEEAATDKLQTPLHVAAKKGHADVVKVRTEIFYKVRKGAKLRNQYNQVPHLTQDTT